MWGTLYEVWSSTTTGNHIKVLLMINRTLKRKRLPLAKYPIHINTSQKHICVYICISPLLCVKNFSRLVFSIFPHGFFFLPYQCFSLASLSACQGPFSRGVSLHCTLHFSKTNWSYINGPVSPTQNNSHLFFIFHLLCLSLVTKIMFQTQKCVIARA